MKQNSTIKEQSLHPQPAARTQTQPHSAPDAEKCDDKLDERICTALHAGGEKKAIDPVVLDLREIASFTDYFVIFSGANERQVQAISDEIYETLKKAGEPRRASRVTRPRNGSCWTTAISWSMCSSRRRDSFTTWSVCGASRSEFSCRLSLPAKVRVL